MDKKKTLIIGLAIIAVCLAIVVVNLFINRSTSREPTSQELEACAPYTVDWSAVPGAQETMTEKAIILSLCTSAGEETVGDNTYESYTTDQLQSYLYQCQTITEIVVGSDGLLHVSYTTTDGKTVILGYNDDGLYEKGVYDPATDTFFHQLDGTAVVWMKFATGIQWG